MLRGWVRLRVALPVICASAIALALTGGLRCPYHGYAALRSALAGVDPDGIAGIWVTPTMQVHGIVVHHSATPARVGRLTIGASVIDKLHQRRGFCALFSGRFYHIGYHYVVRADGSLEVGRPETCRGAHAGTPEGNSRNLGVVLVGEFTSAAQSPHPEQLRVATALLRTLVRRYSLTPSSVVGHGELNSRTACPGAGVDMVALRRLLVQAETSSARREIGRHRTP